MSSSSSSSPEITAAQSTEDTLSRFSYADATHEEVLDDLSSRFILNLPDEELSSLERICFQVEQAHWYYEDFIREENPSLPSLPLKKFSEMLFHACPLLHQWSHDHEQAFNTFMQYKTRVPVCGAIMLNDTWDKCVLVKGWKSSSGWGFPKGKINEDEPQTTCAIREVLEETGYNLQGKIDPRDVIEMSIKEQKVSLFIVPGVPEDFPFKTKTRKEISKIEWFKLTDLPTWKKNKQVPGKFYLISPFIGALKAFINERKPRNTARKARSKKLHTVSSYQQQNGNNVRLDQDAAQESSSSADNAGPQTPSPHYPEPVVNTIHIGTTVSSATPAPLDPHFARLLSSLTLSASKEVPASPAVDIGHSVSSDSIPLPITESNRIPLAKESDWSSSTPSRLTERKSLFHNESALVASIEVQPTKNGATEPQLTQHPQTLVNGATVDNRNHLSPRPLQDALTSPALSSLSPRSTTTRRSSTADISPYLSRPTEIPTSAKRLKQLALLEAVADESARMTPVIAARVATATPGMDNSFQSNASFGYSLGYNLSRQGNGNDPNILYSTNPSAGKALHSYASSPHHEPLQMRARTSQAFHRPPVHLPGSMSMSQGQLLAMINSAGVPPNAATIPQSVVSAVPLEPRQQYPALYNNASIMVPGPMIPNAVPHPHSRPLPQYLSHPIPMHPTMDHAMGPPAHFQPKYNFPQQTRSPFLAQTPVPVLNHGIDSLPKGPNASSTALLSILNGNKL